MVFKIPDQALCDEAAGILEQMGLDMETVIRIVMKRITNEKDLSFIFSKPTEQTAVFSHGFDNHRIKMTKSKAVYLFSSKGYTIHGNVTFASKNRSAYDYWANPNVSYLLSDWYLILNDWNEQSLHLFFMPKGSLSLSELVPRSDKPEQIDLQIMYDDDSFTDTRSKLSFRKFYVDTIDY